MASTSASPGARNAAPMPPAPIASHGNLHRPPPIAASIPTKSPARFRATAAINAPAMAAANTSPLPASARGNLSRNIKGRFATSAPRKRRDAAPRSRYWMRPWPQNAALAARLGFRAARISSQWPDMLEIRNAALSLRILTCAVLLGIAAPGAPALAQTNDDAMAQMNQDAPPQQGAQGNPICIRLEGQLATIDRGAGTGDPAKDEQIRRYQEAPGQATGRTRSGHAAGQAHGLRKLGLLLAVQRPVRAVRSGQQPDSADARQSRPDHHQPGAAAQRRHRRRRPRKPAPLGADGARAEQLRPAICRCRARSRQLHRQSVRQQPDAAAAQRRSRRAVRHLPHRLRPHLRRRLISRCRSPPTRRGFRTTRGPARRFARRRKRRCSPTAIPARTSTRRSRSAASPIRRCRTRSNSAPSSTPSCACKAAGQTWSEALKSVDDRAGVEQQGDIIVTEESAKRMQQRAQPKGAPPPPAPRRAQRPPAPPPRRLQQPPRPIRRLPPPTRTRSARWARPSSRRSNKRA